MSKNIGARVLISEDCREGGKATGMYGTYEGDFPLTVVFGYQPNKESKTDWKLGEYSYEDYKSGFIKMQDGTPANEFYKEWVRGQECPRPFFAMPMDNPRIRLDDGSIIWGCQCWWGEVIDGLTLQEAQKCTEEVKEGIRSLVSAISKIEDDIDQDN